MQLPNESDDAFVSGLSQLGQVSASSRAPPKLREPRPSSPPMTGTFKRSPGSFRLPVLPSSPTQKHSPACSFIACPVAKSPGKHSRSNRRKKMRKRPGKHDGCIMENPPNAPIAVNSDDILVQMGMNTTGKNKNQRRRMRKRLQAEQARASAPSSTQQLPASPPPDDKFRLPPEVYDEWEEDDWNSRHRGEDEARFGPTAEVRAHGVTGGTEDVHVTLIRPPVLATSDYAATRGSCTEPHGTHGTW